MLTGPTDDAPLLQVDNLVRHFRKPPRRPFAPAEVVHALDGVSFTLRRGETLGLVGESGCGKSTVGRILLGIDRPTTGRVLFRGTDVHAARGADRRHLQCDMQMIFQDPIGALDPRMSIADQVREPLDIHDRGTPEERRALVAETIAAVGLAPEMGSRYPHELSGGQQQRAVIARALVLRPALIVCDEPISALDVSIQAQVINLLEALQETHGPAYVFISHDLTVVRHISDLVAVMYLGEIVEAGAKADIFRAPSHPYTQALISAIPVADPAQRGHHKRVVLSGEPPSPLKPPEGCRFHPRCPCAQDICRRVAPPPREIVPGHFAACHFAGEVHIAEPAPSAGPAESEVR